MVETRAPEPKPTRDPEPAGKNIVVLSDGTGNRGAKAQGTNVWALYERLERGAGAPRQIAFYDDGVGTERSLPRRLLGQAFGLGLYRNVQEAYAFLVRTYEPGDRLFLFGFSRGAYTARTLAGLVTRYGILRRERFDREEDLARAVESTCRSQRATFGVQRRAAAEAARTPGRPAVLPAPVLVGGLDPADFHHEPRPGRPHGVDVRFLGVFDTVDAVGLPFDALAEALNRVVQWRFADLRVSPRVHCARQALALDEARRTFRPRLWEEERPMPTLADGRPRVEQVWFPGVHTNVGGGYDKDQLAYVALDWMLAEARREGLRFPQPEHERIATQADALGLQMDSRAGLGALYRHRARAIATLCRSAGIRRPRLHVGVLERCREAPLGYAPVLLPRRVTLVAPTRGGVRSRPARLVLDLPRLRSARRLARLEPLLHPLLLAWLAAPGLLALAQGFRGPLVGLARRLGPIPALTGVGLLFLVALLASRAAEGFARAPAAHRGAGRVGLALLRGLYLLAIGAAALVGLAIALGGLGLAVRALGQRLPMPPGAAPHVAVVVGLWYGLGLVLHAVLKRALGRRFRRAALDAFLPLRRGP